MPELEVAGVSRSVEITVPLNGPAANGIVPRRSKLGRRPPERLPWIRTRPSSPASGPAQRPLEAMPAKVPVTEPRAEKDSSTGLKPPLG
jgi:hypothetical protein